jgi:hypothetical protein
MTIGELDGPAKSLSQCNPFASERPAFKSGNF